MNKRCLALIIICMAAVHSACSEKARQGGVAPVENLKPGSAHGTSPEAAGSQAELQFSAPAGWIAETPSSSSRKAQYRLPRAQGDPEDGELVVYYFPGGGGTPQANVDRWIGQFTGPGGTPASGSAKIRHKTANNIRLTIVDVSGTYSSSMGAMQQSGQPKRDYRMLGAIAETGGGPWFFKMTGPRKTVARWESSFEAFLDSIKPSE